MPATAVIILDRSSQTDEVGPSYGIEGGSVCVFVDWGNQLTFVPADSLELNGMPWDTGLIDIS